MQFPYRTALNRTVPYLAVLRPQAYGEVNREVADPGVALKLSGLRPGRNDNIVPASVQLGNKITITAACILGEGCVVGDKSSVKRSVLGNGCKWVAVGGERRGAQGDAEGGGGRWVGWKLCLAACLFARLWSC